MDKGILFKGAILILVFASLVPAVSFVFGDAEIRTGLWAVSTRTTPGILITLGLPIAWLAWRSQQKQQPVFASSHSKLVLVLAAVFTALSVAGFYRFSLRLLPMAPLFPMGLQALLRFGAGGAIRSGLGFILTPVIGWLIYLGLALSVIFSGNRQVARILFILLAALLLANAGGCIHMLAVDGGVDW